MCRGGDGATTEIILFISTLMKTLIHSTLNQNDTHTNKSQHVSSMPTSDDLHYAEKRKRTFHINLGRLRRWLKEGILAGELSVRRV